MCKPASFVVTKKKVFWSKNTESHHEIVSEFGLKEKDVRGNYQLVCIEIVPPGNDFTLPFSKWEFIIDGVGLGGYQRDLPEWYDAKDVERRCRACLKEWRKAKVVMPSEKRRSINTGQAVAIYGQVKYICGSAKVKNIYGSAKVENIHDSAKVEKIHDSAKVKNICGSAKVENICGSATVKNICSSAKVKNICGSATVEDIHGSAKVENIYNSAKVENIHGSAKVKNICGSAKVENIHDSATVENIFGSAKVENIYGSAKVEYIHGSAKVENIYGSAKVENTCNSAKVERASGKCVIVAYNSLSSDILKSSQAVLIDRSGETVKCYVGKDE